MSGKNKKIYEKNSVLFTLKILNTSILNVSNNKFFVVVAAHSAPLLY